MAPDPSTVPLFINGKHITTDATYDIHSPADGKFLHKASAANVDDAKKAIDAAAEALKTWRHTTASERRDIFIRAAEVMERRSGELMTYMRMETGAAPAWCLMNVQAAVDMLKDVAGRIPALTGSFPALNDAQRSAIVVREPFGVVLAIAPWNAPYALGTRSVAFPVAAGNTVVFKASQLAPRTMAAIVAVFHEAGLPKGVINYILHAPHKAAEVTEAIIADPNVKKINFTGSTGVGRMIATQAAKNLKPVLLELGGKAPAIVLEDADIESAAQAISTGAYLNSGQVCMSTARVLVHKAIKSKFVDAFKIAVTEMYPASEAPLTLINKAAVDKTKALIKDATEKGANLLLDWPDIGDITGTQFRPNIIENVTTDMEIYHTESFGPEVSLIEIESDEEAIRIANDTDYGLAAAIYTEDLGRALCMAKKIETGAVHINAQTIHDEPAMPHGGAKSSGFGRFNGLLGLEEWTRTKGISFRN